MLIISNALQRQQGESATIYSLHRSVNFLTQIYHTRWFDAASRNPLGWYAWLRACPAAACLLPFASPQADDRQCWLASPYQGTLQRDRFLMSPESELMWCASDAENLCILLNPVLAESGMRLQAIGGLLLLFSATILDATPQAFSQIDGGYLPNRPPSGQNALALMQAMGNVQTQLYQTPLHRENHDAPVINGLWFHSSVTLPSNIPAPSNTFVIQSPYPVLQPTMDASNKKVQVTIKTAEQCASLDVWPKHILLAGHGAAAALSKRHIWQQWYTRYNTTKNTQWIPHQPDQENTLHQYIQSVC